MKKLVKPILKDMCEYEKELIQERRRDRKAVEEIAEKEERQKEKQIDPKQSMIYSFLKGPNEVESSSSSSSSQDTIANGSTKQHT